MSAKLQILVKDGESAAHLANSLKRAYHTYWHLQDTNHLSGIRLGVMSISCQTSDI